MESKIQQFQSSDDDGADDRTALNMVMPTRDRRKIVLTSRIRDVLQSR